MPPYLEKSRSGKHPQVVMLMQLTVLEILATFQELEWKQRFRLFHAMENPDTSPYRVDRSQVVIERNRYQNVQPWDVSRIKLKTPIQGSDYINASPIVLKSKQNASSDKPQKYIATQGPKQGQYLHFWRMVHQEIGEDTGVIIMLTQLIEENKEKCSPYFPSELEKPTMSLSLNGSQTSDEAQSGDDPLLETSHCPDTNVRKGNTESESDPSDAITLLSKEFDADVACEVRKFRLTIDGTSKTVIHYLFSRWPDFGKPEASDKKGLIKLSRRSYKEAGNSPRFVHCSAGVGRTGTWIALDFLIREVEEERLLESIGATSAQNGSAVAANGEVSGTETWGKSGPSKVMTPTNEEGFDKDELDPIFDVVNTLREQRMMMVIREIQYAFLYEVVRDAVLEKYGAKPEGAVVKDGVDIDMLPRHAKAARISDLADDERASEAETEIMDVSAQRKATDSDDDDDPYETSSPAFIRKGMLQVQGGTQEQ